MRLIEEQMIDAAIQENIEEHGIYYHGGYTRYNRLQNARINLIGVLQEVE